jgi:hypothetical protein
VQTGVGHYGVFNGQRWERQIYPRIRAVIHDNEPRAVPVSTRGAQSSLTLAPAAASSPTTPAGTTPAATEAVDVDLSSDEAATE